MNPDDVLVLIPAVAVIAALYASVGHAGASGYIAVMALAGVSPAVLKPTALLLNVAVSILATWQFARAGHFSWRLFWPFAVLAMPAAFAGGYLDLPTAVFKLLVGCVLVATAVRFLVTPAPREAGAAPPPALAMLSGGGLGLLAGLTGTGGGIFLTPLLLVARWADPKRAAAVSAPFILVNSVAGLAGNLSSTRHLPPVALPLLAAAIAGGALGAHLGSRRLTSRAIQRTLAVVLLVAGAKLIFFR